MVRDFEIVFIVHPESSSQVPHLIDRYRKIVIGGGGEIVRLEDWGVRQLAYPIQKVHKAHYVLMNIRSDSETLNTLEHDFKFNDHVLRHLTIKLRLGTPLSKGRPTDSGMDFFSKDRPLVMDIQCGSASANELADLFHELSVLYQMVGGSGIRFRYNESKNMLAECLV